MQYGSADFRKHLCTIDDVSFDFITVNLLAPGRMALPHALLLDYVAAAFVALFCVQRDVYGRQLSPRWSRTNKLLRCC